LHTDTVPIFYLHFGLSFVLLYAMITTSLAKISEEHKVK